jgi:hypothetical protein
MYIHYFTEEIVTLLFFGKTEVRENLHLFPSLRDAAPEVVHPARQTDFRQLGPILRNIFGRNLRTKT